MTSRTNVQADEALANAVEKYPCLYNKTDKGYKERDRKQNAWRQVEKELGLGVGEAEKQFELLKKRYSRKKNDVRKTTVSGSGAADVVKPKKLLEEYGFMSWLEPFLRGRSKTTCNMPSTPTIDYDDDERNTNEESPRTAAKSDASDSDSNLEEEVSKKSVQSSSKNPAKRLKVDHRDITTDVDVIQGMQSLITKKLENASREKKKPLNGDEIFGRMVGFELSQFPEDYKFIVKHDINDLLYRHQMQRKQQQGYQEYYQQQQQQQQEQPPQQMHEQQYISEYSSPSPTIAMENPTSACEYQNIAEYTHRQ